MAECGLIPLRRKDGSVGAYAVVDAADFASLNRYRWYRMSAGYAARSSPRPNRRTVLMHRQLLGLAAGDRREGDHVNTDRLDYRRSNLRVLPAGRNRANRAPRAYGSSRYRGVSREGTAWLAYGRSNGRQVRLGLYDDELDAARVATAHRIAHMSAFIDHDGVLAAA